MSDEKSERDERDERASSGGDATSGESGKSGKSDESGKSGESGAGHAREKHHIRHGLPGKGFDAGTGYGGAGPDSMYHGGSSYGGQAGYGGSFTRGAYAGGKYGRPDDPGGPFAGRGEDAAGDPPPDVPGADEEEEE